MSQRNRSIPPDDLPDRPGSQWGVGSRIVCPRDDGGEFELLVLAMFPHADGKWSAFVKSGERRLLLDAFGIDFALDTGAWRMKGEPLRR